MNNMNLAGRLTKEPELRKTTEGLSVCMFTIAVDRPVSKKNAKAGEQTADFIQCVAWRQSAEYLCKYGHKGDLVTASGPLHTRNYKDKDGRTVYVTEVTVNDLQVYSRQPQKQPEPKAEWGTDTTISTEDNVPW